HQAPPAIAGLPGNVHRPQLDARQRIIIIHHSVVSGRCFDSHTNRDVAVRTGLRIEHLYRHELATYDEGDQYDASAAQGFIKIHGLSQTTQAKFQMLKGTGRSRLELPTIIPPDPDHS